MSEFLMDKAIMALKAQRFDEAQSAYEDILKGGYTVEAWCGLGACKMFQLASGQTLEEVVYCYEKAMAVEGADKLFVDKHLISHVNVVCSQYAAYAIEAIKQAIQAEKDATRAAVIGLVAAGVGGMSSGLNTKIIAGVAAGVSAGVAIGKFAEIKDSKEIAQYCVNMLESTHASVENFLLENSKLQEAVDLRENIESLGQQVFQALPERIRKLIETRQRVAASLSIKTGNAALDEVFNLNNLPVSSGWGGYKLDKYGPVIEGDIGMVRDHGKSVVTAEEMSEHDELFLFAIRDSAGATNCVITNKRVLYSSGLSRRWADWNQVISARSADKGGLKTVLLDMQSGKSASLSLIAFVEPGMTKAANVIAGYINDELIGSKIDGETSSAASNEHDEETAEVEKEDKSIDTNLREKSVEAFANSSGSLANYNLPLCEKYNIPEDSIVYGALIQRRQSEVGLFKKDKYKKLFMSAILKQYNVKFMDWGNLGLELKKSGIADDRDLLSRYSHISVE